METIKIEICMGSSCFSRGNNRTVEVLQRYCAEQKLPAQIELCGSLCTGGCTNGPHIKINGQSYDQVEHTTILDILEHVLRVRT
jgi:NADH:ubiquinone oxidoreductase subunit E